jgi:pyruvate/2-oxoglutarate dehydrogenase complex dihydrolipoamide dehydrogenase (E3) component
MVGDQELEARRAVILAGGTVPLIPAIEGLEQVESLWTNRDATTAEQIPGRMVIVGGGPVGVEMAQAFRTLGSQVTLIEGEHRLLPRHALGRKPSTGDLGLEAVGLEPGGFVDVDAHMRVPDVPWLYAVGDINGRALFTHMGKYQARLAADRILGHEHAVAHGADGRQAPHVIFTDPQIGSVGHTTETATRAGIESDVYDTETSGNPCGLFYAPGAPGTTSFIVDRRRRVLLGCTITGSEIADFLHAATIAVAAEVPLERLRHAVPPFPTRSEIWLSLLVQAGA